LILFRGTPINASNSKNNEAAVEYNVENGYANKIKAQRNNIKD